MKEDRAKKVLFRSAFGTQKPGWLRNAFDMRLKNPANTNAVVWGGRLLALWEVRRCPLPPPLPAAVNPPSCQRSP